MVPKIRNVRLNRSYYVDCRYIKVWPLWHLLRDVIVTAQKFSMKSNTYFRFSGHVSDRRLVTHVPHGGRRRILGVIFFFSKIYLLFFKNNNKIGKWIQKKKIFSRLHQIMNNSKIAMHGFFIHGFPKLMRFQQHHDKVMRKFLPRLVTFTNHRWRCCLIIQIILWHLNFVYLQAQETPR